ncbi:hypothetical protein ACHAW5_001012 [Stephanodiscus triporus]|uniref:Uncharacterized protein n=1 Tax=Stephanodiscus triporus TaxID=2934178 RepID=A0ABD3Q2J4_9STRA
MSPTDPETDHASPSPECVPGNAPATGPPTSIEPCGNGGGVEGVVTIWASTKKKEEEGGWDESERIVRETSARDARDTMRRAIVVVFVFFFSDPMEIEMGISNVYPGSP